MLFPDVPDEKWNDLKWQVKNRIETLEDLKRYINLTPQEEGIKQSQSSFRMAITPLLPRHRRFVMFCCLVAMP